MIRASISAKEWDDYKAKILDIKNFRADGFKHVCDVDSYSMGKWWYKNIDQSLMFSEHTSWVYMIVLDSTIVKVGETGNPLGIYEHYVYGNHETQPRTGTKCRLGRLRSGDGTDAYIRTQLTPCIKQGSTVGIWAKKCPVRMLTESVCGIDWKVQTEIHKSLELAYLHYFENTIGQRPILNKAKK